MDTTTDKLLSECSDIMDTHNEQSTEKGEFDNELIECLDGSEKIDSVAESIIMDTHNEQGTKQVNLDDDLKDCSDESEITYSFTESISMDTHDEQCADQVKLDDEFVIECSDESEIIDSVAESISVVSNLEQGTEQVKFDNDVIEILNESENSDSDTESVASSGDTQDNLIDSCAGNVFDINSYSVSLINTNIGEDVNDDQVPGDIMADTNVVKDADILFEESNDIMVDTNDVKGADNLFKEFSDIMTDTNDVKGTDILFEECGDVMADTNTVGDADILIEECADSKGEVDTDKDVLNDDKFLNVEMSQDIADIEDSESADSIQCTDFLTICRNSVEKNASEELNGESNYKTEGEIGVDSVLNVIEETGVDNSLTGEIGVDSALNVVGEIGVDNAPTPAGEIVKSLEVDSSLKSEREIRGDFTEMGTFIEKNNRIILVANDDDKEYLKNCDSLLVSDNENDYDEDCPGNELLDLDSDSKSNLNSNYSDENRDNSHVQLVGAESVQIETDIVDDFDLNSLSSAASKADCFDMNVVPQEDKDIEMNKVENEIEDIELKDLENEWKDDEIKAEGSAVKDTTPDLGQSELEIEMKYKDDVPNQTGLNATESEHNEKHKDSELKDIGGQLEGTDVDLNDWEHEVKNIRVEDGQSEVKDVGMEGWQSEVKDVGIEGGQSEVKVIGMEDLQSEVKDVGMEGGQSEVKDIGMEGGKSKVKVIRMEGGQSEVKDIRMEGGQSEVKVIRMEGGQSEVKVIGMEGGQSKVKDIEMEGGQSEIKDTEMESGQSEVKDIEVKVGQNEAKDVEMEGGKNEVEGIGMEGGQNDPTHIQMMLTITEKCDDNNTSCDSMETNLAVCKTKCGKRKFTDQEDMEFESKKQKRSDSEITEEFEKQTGIRLKSGNVKLRRIPEMSTYLLKLCVKGKLKHYKGLFEKLRDKVQHNCPDVMGVGDKYHTDLIAAVKKALVHNINFIEKKVFAMNPGNFVSSYFLSKITDEVVAVLKNREGQCGTKDTLMPLLEKILAIVLKIMKLLHEHVLENLFPDDETLHQTCQRSQKVKALRRQKFIKINGVPLMLLDEQGIRQKSCEFLIKKLQELMEWKESTKKKSNDLFYLMAMKEEEKLKANNIREAELEKEEKDKFEWAKETGLAMEDKSKKNEAENSQKPRESGSAKIQVKKTRNLLIEEWPNHMSYQEFQTLHSNNMFGLMTPEDQIELVGKDFEWLQPSPEIIKKCIIPCIDSELRRCLARKSPFSSRDLRQCVLKQKARVTRLQLKMMKLKCAVKEKVLHQTLWPMPEGDLPQFLKPRMVDWPGEQGLADESDSVVIGQSDGAVVGQSDGAVIGQSDGAVIGQSDGAVIGQSDGAVIGPSDGAVIGQSDGVVIGQLDENSSMIKFEVSKDDTGKAPSVVSCSPSVVSCSPSVVSCPPSVVSCPPYLALSDHTSMLKKQLVNPPLVVSYLHNLALRDHRSMVKKTFEAPSLVASCSPSIVSCSPNLALDQTSMIKKQLEKPPVVVSCPPSSVVSNNTSLLTRKSDPERKVTHTTNIDEMVIKGNTIVPKYLYRYNGPCLYINAAKPGEPVKMVPLMNPISNQANPGEPMKIVSLMNPISNPTIPEEPMKMVPLINPISNPTIPEEPMKMVPLINPISNPAVPGKPVTMVSLMNPISNTANPSEPVKTVPLRNPISNTANPGETVKMVPLMNPISNTANPSEPVKTVPLMNPISNPVNPGETLKMVPLMNPFNNPANPGETVNMVPLMNPFSNLAPVMSTRESSQSKKFQKICAEPFPVETGIPISYSAVSPQPDISYSAVGPQPDISYSALGPQPDIASTMIMSPVVTGLPEGPKPDISTTSRAGSSTISSDSSVPVAMFVNISGSMAQDNSTNRKVERRLITWQPIKPVESEENLNSRVKEKKLLPTVPGKRAAGIVQKKFNSRLVAVHPIQPTTVVPQDVLTGRLVEQNLISQSGVINPPVREQQSNSYQNKKTSVGKYSELIGLLSAKPRNVLRPGANKVATKGIHFPPVSSQHTKLQSIPGVNLLFSNKEFNMQGGCNQGTNVDVSSEDVNIQNSVTEDAQEVQQEVNTMSKNEPTVKIEVDDTFSEDSPTVKIEVDEPSFQEYNLVTGGNSDDTKADGEPMGLSDSIRGDGETDTWTEETPIQRKAKSISYLHNVIAKDTESREIVSPVENVIIEGDPNDEIVIKEEPNDEVFIKGDPNNEIVIKGDPNDIVIKQEANDEIVIKGDPNDEIVIKGDPNDEEVVKEDPNDEIVINWDPNDEIVKSEYQNSIQMNQLSKRFHVPAKTTDCSLPLFVGMSEKCCQAGIGDVDSRVPRGNKRTGKKRRAVRVEDDLGVKGSGIPYIAENSVSVEDGVKGSGTPCIAENSGNSCQPRVDDSDTSEFQSITQLDQRSKEDGLKTKIVNKPMIKKNNKIIMNKAMLEAVSKMSTCTDLSNEVINRLDKEMAFVHLSANQDRDDMEGKSVWTNVVDKFPYMPTFLQTRKVSLKTWVVVTDPKYLHSYQCTLCGTILRSTNTEMFTHSLKHRYTCRVCENSFMFKHEFYQHFVLSHTCSGELATPDVQLFLGTEDTSCGLCGDKTTLHGTSPVEDGKPQSCLCKVTCTKMHKKGRAKHYQFHRYGDKGSPFSCVVCKKVFWYKSTHNLHYILNLECMMKTLAEKSEPEEALKGMNDQSGENVEEEPGEVSLTDICTPGNMSEEYFSVIIQQKKANLLKRKMAIEQELKRRLMCSQSGAD